MLARDLNNARNAYKAGDVEMLKDSHKSKVNNKVNLRIKINYWIIKKNIKVEVNS
jgi:hypothetical protein